MVAVSLSGGRPRREQLGRVKQYGTTGRRLKSRTATCARIILGSAVGARVWLGLEHGTQDGSHRDDVATRLFYLTPPLLSTYE